MKTGILTFQDTNNFGSLLQTFALYKTITDNFGECEIIDYKCEEIEKREIPKSISRLRSIKDIYRYIMYHAELEKKYQALSHFSKQHMNFSTELKKSDIQDYSICYDRIIVGSDIVWGLDITGEDYTYFLDFYDKGKYSYASSFGSDYILNNQNKEKVGSLLSSFRRLSVREKDACDIIKSISGRDAELVVDPTLLLDLNAWKPFISGRPIKEKYILLYFEDEKGVVANAAKTISQQLNLPVYNITNGKKMREVNNVSVYQLEDFLAYLYYAEYIVTASYHGMAFSINFNKNFSYFNRCHKSRMETLAYISGLKSRELMLGMEAFDFSSIDYNQINKNILKWRNQSYTYLKGIFEND